MIVRLVSLLAAAVLLAPPVAAQTAPAPVGIVAPVLPTFQFRPGRPDIARGPELGARVGNAAQASLAYRGPYGFGQCPADTILTTFGTCAQRR